MSDYTVVIPTIGRPSLHRLLRPLSEIPRVIVVDDRPPGRPSLHVPEEATVLRTRGGEGPAAARNRGWQAAESEWVVFLDDDVEPSPTWQADLEADLADCAPRVAASQGRVTVPLPRDRPPTDRERNVHGLEQARWITADMACRRAALERLGGFDERFRRAYREDADLALRLRRDGWDLTMGRRQVRHPVGRAPWWSSIRDQRGNRDDVLMRRLHGSDWRERAGAGAGRRRRHLAITSLLCSAVVAAARRRRATATVTAAMWLAATGAFAWERIRPGPRTADEVLAMAVTSAAIPPTAVFWRLMGEIFDRPSMLRREPVDRVEAVLFDRDGTLIENVPYNGDPDSVRLVPGAREAIDLLRTAGIRVGLVSNQSGVGKGLIGPREVEAVNRRVSDLVGGLDLCLYCPHVPDDRCRCRKPGPGLVIEAARRLGVSPGRCVVVGDILTDVLAGEAAGGRGILVPNGATAPGESRAADHVVSGVRQAAELTLTWGRG